MSPDPSQDQSTEEIIDLTDIVEDDQVEEEYSAAEVAGSSDRETQESLDEASLEEELSDFFAKLDEGDEEATELETGPEDSGLAAAGKAQEEENFDLDDLFEDISEQESDTTGAEDTPLDQDPWEDIDLELPGAEPTAEDTVDEGDDFSELDDLFDDLEKDQSPEQEPQADDSEKEPAGEEPLEEVATEAETTEPVVELEEEPWVSSGAQEGLPGATSEEVNDLKERVRLLEERLDAQPSTPSSEDVSRQVQQELADSLQPGALPEGLLDVLTQRLEDSLWPGIQEKLSSLRQDIESRIENLSVELKGDTADLASTEELEKLRQGLKDEISREIAESAPAIAAAVIREEIATLTRDVDED